MRTDFLAWYKCLAIVSEIQEWFCCSTQKTYFSSCLQSCFSLLFCLISVSQFQSRSLLAERLPSLAQHPGTYYTFWFLPFCLVRPYSLSVCKINKLSFGGPSPIFHFAWVCIMFYSFISILMGHQEVDTMNACAQPT